MPEWDYEKEYHALERALVGDTGQSALLMAHRLRSENAKLLKENERLRQNGRAPEGQGGVSGGDEAGAEQWSSQFWRGMERAPPLGVCVEAGDGMVTTTKDEFVRLCRISYAAQASWALQRVIPELAEALKARA